MWTIEYNAEEKSFEGWGITAQPASRTRANMGIDSVVIRTAEACEATELFGYGEELIIRRDRSVAFAGGTIFFRGRVGGITRHGSGTVEGITYSIYGPWWDFTRLVMQHEWNEFAGWSTPGDPNSDPTWVVPPRRSSELFLGQAVDGSRLTTGGQIAEAVNWAAACGVAVQVGTIDPATNFPIYNTRDVTVSEVITQMMRWTPDVICWFDYATSPPTFHARRLANLSAVAVSADGVVQEVSLVPRYDLQLPAVCLRFKSTNTVDGRPSVVFTNQNAPGNATGMEMGASIHTIELMGSQSNNVYGDLECVSAAGCQSMTAAERIGWWKKKEPLLSSDFVDGLQLSIANVLDDAGAAYTLVYEPYELLAGSVAAWMTVGAVPVVEKRVTIKASASYDLYRVPVRRNGANQVEVYVNGIWMTDYAGKFLVEKGRRKELSANVRITNAPGGSYDAQSSFSAGEGVPVGLAADIYNAHQTLQYEGQLTWVGEDVPFNIGMGTKLNVTVGAVTYQNLLVQSVTEDLGAGRMAVTVGPASHLGLSDLIELLRVNRHRLVINNPRTRTTGSVSGDGTVTLGKATARENTTTGLGDRSSMSVGDGIPAARGVATLNGGGVDAVAVTYGSMGYIQTPIVSFEGGGGSGASAHATVSRGVVTAVVMDTAGSGYATAPTVLFTAPQAKTRAARLDADSGLVMEAMNVSGAPAQEVGSILLSLGDAVGREIRLREVSICVGGATRYILVLCSLPYD